MSLHHIYISTRCLFSNFSFVLTMLAPLLAPVDMMSSSLSPLSLLGRIGPSFVCRCIIFILHLVFHRVVLVSYRITSVVWNLLYIFPLIIATSYLLYIILISTVFPIGLVVIPFYHLPWLFNDE